MGTGVYLYMSTLWCTGDLLGLTWPLADGWLHVVTLGRACSCGDDPIYFLRGKRCHIRLRSSCNVLCVAKDKHLDNEHLVWLPLQLMTAQFSLLQHKMMIHFTSELGISGHSVRVPNCCRPAQQPLGETQEYTQSIVVSPSKVSGIKEQLILNNIVLNNTLLCVM